MKLDKKFSDTQNQKCNLQKKKKNDELNFSRMKDICSVKNTVKII